MKAHMYTGVLLAVSSAPAMAATTIDFTGQAAGQSITNQYAAQGVVFSAGTTSGQSNAAISVFTSNPSLANSTDGGNNRLMYLFFDFTSAVSGLSFGYTNYGGNFTSNNFVAFDSLGNVLEARSPTAASANGFELISFTSSNISRLRLQQPTSGWIFAVDNITFSPSVVAGIPEPSAWAMMTLGFGAMGFAMRRKKVSTRIRFA